MPDFELRSGGKIYTGWTSLSVTRSMEQLAHSFSVELTDLWHEGSEPIPIEAGDSCSISIDGEKLVTGYVDSDGSRYDGNNRTLTFAGRSKTGDLVDCAAIYKGGQWRNKGLLQIAKDLCEPFEIEASAASGVDMGEKFRRFSIQEGETAFSTIERGARMRGLLHVTDDDGNLVFTRASTTLIDTVLERGVNILRGTKNNDWQDRYSNYTVKTQAAGDDQTYGSAASSIKRESADSGVTRYRPTHIMAENEDSGKELQERADWERNVRAGRSKRLSYTVTGWKHSHGLWSPNQLARVIDPNERVDDKLLLSSVTQTRDNSGTFSMVELTLPEAFTVQPLPPPKKKSGSFW